MIYFLLFCTLLMGGGFFILNFIEPRTLFLGASFSAFCLCMISLVGRGLEGIHFGIIVVFSFFVVPIILTGALVVRGIRNFNSNGFSRFGILFMLVGLGLIFYLTFWPLNNDLTKLNLWNIIYGNICLIVFYMLGLLNIYTLTSAFNLLHLKRRKLDYIVVLGAGLAGDKVTPILATRIERAITLHHQQPQTKLIMSGGQGEDELIAEGIAMAAYAQTKGVNPTAIILEDQAVNTFENIAFSYALINNLSARVGIVSSNYHIMRALLIAKDLGYSCIGYGSRGPLLFSLNAYVREFVAYLYMKRSIHFFGVVMLNLLYLIVQGVTIITYYQTNP